MGIGGRTRWGSQAVCFGAGELGSWKSRRARGVPPGPLPWISGEPTIKAGTDLRGVNSREACDFGDSCDWGGFIRDAGLWGGSI